MKNLFVWSEETCMVPQENVTSRDQGLVQQRYVAFKNI